MEVRHVVGEVRVGDRDRDERTHRLRVGEDGHARTSRSSTCAKYGASTCCPFSRKKRNWSRVSPSSCQTSCEVVHRRVRDRDETCRQDAARARSSSDRLLERRDVIEHPRRRRRSRSSRRRTASAWTSPIPRIDPARRGQLDHARRVVDGDDAPRRARSSSRYGELARAAADLEHARRAAPPRPPRTPRPRRPGPRRAPGRRRCACARPLLARVLPRDDGRVVERSRARRSACPGMPRDGALPPSQALTVAPTSANSPSWIRPAAFLPST